MSPLRPTLALTLATACAACATRPFDVHFEAGRYDEAVRTFQTDTALHRDERALLRAAIAHAVPTSGAYRPDRARELLRRLLTLYPDGKHGRDARTLLALLDELDLAAIEAQRLRQRVDSLRLRVSELEAERHALQTLLERERNQADLLRILAERLESNLRRTEYELRMLNDDLQRLKEVDLERLRSRGTTPPPAIPDPAPPPDTTTNTATDTTTNKAAGRSEP